MIRSPKSSRKNHTVSLQPNAVVLTIAGSDPSGGAGLQADLKTFQQLDVYGMSVVTLITAQNTLAVRKLEVLSPDLIEAQLDAVLDDIPAKAIKTGALGSADVVRLVGDRLQDVQVPIVVDPVLVSKHGDSLVTDDVVQAYREFLLPRALLVTPNRWEAERLTGLTLDSEQAVSQAIAELQRFGARHVLIKLGEVDGKSHHVLSLHEENRGLVMPRLDSNNTHGTGCILSAAIAAAFALGESDVLNAVIFGIERTFQAIQVDTKLGKGIHPAEIRAMVKI
jgi:hydroxymethylpyrimidine/phosphomethylpyrimidine kinase